MKAFIEYLLRALVDRPVEVDVREVVGEQTVVYELRVGGGELGKVIGKNGRTIRALRTILASAAAREQRRVVLELLE
jgi:uncharacterized protein